MQAQSHITPELFSQRTDALAFALGVSLRELGGKVGVSTAMIFAYRSGRTPVSGKAWKKILTAEHAAGIRSENDVMGAMIREDQEGHYDGPRDTVEEIEHHHQSLLLAADGDPVRLGWIREQQRAHLAIPAHWQSKGSGITRVYDRAQKTALSTHTGLPVPGPSQRTRSA